MNKVVLKDYLFLSNEEHKELLEIRNKEYIRNVSLDTGIIELINHISFVKGLKNSDKKFFAIIFEDRIIGGVNIFNIKEDIKWGVFFLEEANILIKSIVPLYFLEYIFKTFEKEEIFLDVKKENINTISYDKNLGFNIFKEDDKIISMKMSKLEFENAKEKPFLKRVMKQLEKFDFERISYEGVEV
jgi:UDP-4-amino-4,6-dideoxy-N-acetyl-beta-L-altrosamine N-acetyltransferase